MGFIAKLSAEWAETERARQLKEAEEKINLLLLAGKNNLQNQEAAKQLRDAQNAFDNRAYAVAASFCNKLLRDCPGSASEARARELLQEAEKADVEQRKLSEIQGRLIKKVGNFLLAEDFAGAVDAVTGDKEYQEHFPKLPEINQQLEVWRRKAREKKNP